MKKYRQKAVAEYPEFVSLEDKIAVRISGAQRRKVKVVCPDCGEGRYVFKTSINQRLKKNTFTGLCHSCADRQLSDRRKNQRGERNPYWRGGRHITPDGYVLCTVEPGHPFFCMAGYDNRILEHRLVMAEYLSRPLLPNENVHHVDGNPSNNDTENLVLMTWANHARFERLLSLGKVERKDVINYAINFVLDKPRNMV